RALRGDEAKAPSTLVFPAQVDPVGLARRLRVHLQLAGIRRPEPFEHTEARLPIRVHDLRGSSVTIALANGRTEAWVTDRTGHKSSAMVAKYRRAARTAEEARLGDWTPLDAAIFGHRFGHGRTGGGSGPKRDQAAPQKPREKARIAGIPKPLVGRSNRLGGAIGDQNGDQR